MINPKDNNDRELTRDFTVYVSEAMKILSTFHEKVNLMESINL